MSERILLLWLGAALSAGAGTLDEFIGFQTNRPAVRSLAYKRTIPRERGEPEAHIVHARWQTNAFYFRELKDLGSLDFLDLAPHGDFVSCYRTNYWSAESDKLFMYAGPELEQVQVVRSAKLRLEEVNRVLGLGLDGVRPGTARWTGRSFEARTDQGRISGVLQLDSDGEPRVLDYQLEQAGKALRRRVRYYYSSSLSFSGLPYQIAVFDLAGEAEKSRESFEIFQLEAGDPLPRTAFDPDSHPVRGVAPAYKRAFCTTNGVTIEVQAPPMEITSPR